MNMISFISTALAALILAGCGNTSGGTRLTPAQLSDFADEMTQPDPMTTGQIPAAGGFR